jgi:hypothetical protein
VTNLPRRAQRAEASPIIACGPKHGESGAVRYFRMGAVAADPALSHISGRAPSLWNPAPSGSRGIGATPAPQRMKSCVKVGVGLGRFNCQLFPENKANPDRCHVFADYCQHFPDRTSQAGPNLPASTQRLVHIVPISDIMSSEPKVELSLHDLVYPSLTLGSVGDPMCSYFFANCPLKVA